MAVDVTAPIEALVSLDGDTNNVTQEFSSNSSPRVEETRVIVPNVKDTAFVVNKLPVTPELEHE